MIFLPAYYNDVPLIAQQARRLGIAAQLVGSDAWSSPEIIKLGGADVDDSYFCNHYSSEIATAVAQKFVSDYKAKYGRRPTTSPRSPTTPSACWRRRLRTPEARSASDS